MSLQIERLPNSPTEQPALLGMYDELTNCVQWAIDDPTFYAAPAFMDGSNWFTVWKVNDVIHCQATQWYHPRGDFCMRVTDLTPDQAVAMASQAANLASQYMDGDLKLEKTS